MSDLLAVVAIALMCLTTLLAFVPILSASLLTWLVAIGYAVVTEFDRVPIPAAALMTALMLIAVTNSLWLPLIGARAGGVSCLASLGTLIGGLAGTFLIPIPLCGTLIGAIAGAMLLEALRARSMQALFSAGRFAAQTYVIGIGIELMTCVLIIGIFIASLTL
jgi:uncharacterized protein YqgC (DUF456 family)